MKWRHIILINLIFIGLMSLSASVVYQYITGNSPFTMFANWGKSQSALVSTAACNDKQPLNNLKGAEHASLRKLDTYQEACHSYVTGTVMVFMSMAPNTTDAVEYAKQDANTLKTFAKAGIRPLVIAEPSDHAGTTMDFAQFANGSYNTAIEKYFAELKAQGITDQQLGIWNPFPEANLPYWNNNRTEYFAPAVNNYIAQLKKHFPKAETSIMLNSATYDHTDFNWENGDYNSLLPYVKNINKGTITYAGLQGFPWAARQGGTATIFNAAEFLNPELLTEMAESLGTKKVWLNTGTFGRKYTLDATITRTISPEQRKEIMMTIKEQASTLQKDGYQVAVNIFAQDKSEESEATDWSYWGKDGPFSSTATPVLTDFVKDLNTLKIDFWLFDR
jgi:hypothetical protein